MVGQRNELGQVAVAAPENRDIGIQQQIQELLELLLRLQEEKVLLYLGHHLQPEHLGLHLVDGLLAVAVAVLPQMVLLIY